MEKVITAEVRVLKVGEKVSPSKKIALTPIGDNFVGVIQDEERNTIIQIAIPKEQIKNENYENEKK